MVKASLMSVRRKYLRMLHDKTGRNTIAYYSGFFSKQKIEGLSINDQDKNGFMLCVHDVDKTKGLDLILHTPGGSISATESIVHYLRHMFGSDIRAIIPQISMSAGTMLACSCKSRATSLRAVGTAHRRSSAATKTQLAAADRQRALYRHPARYQPRYRFRRQCCRHSASCRRQ